MRASQAETTSLLIDAELTSEAVIFLGGICYGEKGKKVKDEGYQLVSH